MFKACHKHQLKHRSWTVNAFHFEPTIENSTETGAIFTHGYTSHKGDLIAWAIKMAELGIPTVIFDLPGHYLGSFNEVLDFEEFCTHVHELFEKAYSLLNSNKLIIGGHSLGAFLSLKSTECFTDIEKVVVAVGLGLSNSSQKLLQQMVGFRQGLVSPALNYDQMRNWMQERLSNLTINNQDILLLTGDNDFIAPPASVEKLQELLEQNHNRVTFIKAAHLAHNRPDLAATHIKGFIKERITQS